MTAQRGWLLIAAAVGANACTSILGGFDFSGPSTGGTAGAGGTTVTLTSSTGGGTSSSTSASTSSSGGAGGGGGDGGTLSDVNGSVTVTFIQSSAPFETKVGVDLSSGHIISALSPKPGGGFDEITGVGHQDGSFTITSVPPGSYYLRVDDSYFWLTSRVVDLGRYAVGRPDQSPTTQLTLVSLAASDLAPWDAGDDIALVSFAANVLAGQPYSSIVGGGLPAGATTGQFDPFFWNASGTTTGNLLKASDDLQLLQAKKKNSGGVDYYATVKWASMTGATVNDGAAAQISASFVAATSAMQKNLTLPGWKIASDNGLMTAVHPGAQLGMHNVGVVVQPGSASHGALRPAMYLARAGRAPSSAEVAGFTMSYIDPFAGLQEYGVASVCGHVDYQLPGATYAVTATGCLRHSDVLATFAASILEAKLSPPEVPLIGGKPLAQDQTLAGATPSLDWQSPKVGSARNYVLSVNRLYVDPNGFTLQESVARIFTDQTSLQLPPGILKSNERYSFVLEAVASTGDYQAAPDKGGMPQANAPALSGILTVP